MIPQAVLHPDFVTTGGAALLANRTVETIRTWVKAGRLPVAYRTATGWRILRREDVLRVAQARTEALAETER
jgi:DNA-binding transcriptional MerR regulator